MKSTVKDIVKSLNLLEVAISIILLTWESQAYNDLNICVARLNKNAYSSREYIIRTQRLLAIGTKRNDSTCTGSTGSLLSNYQSDKGETLEYDHQSSQSDAENYHNQSSQFDLENYYDQSSRYDLENYYDQSSQFDLENYYDQSSRYYLENYYDQSSRYYLEKYYNQSSRNDSENYCDQPSRSDILGYDDLPSQYDVEDYDYVIKDSKVSINSKQESSSRNDELFKGKREDNSLKKKRKPSSVIEKNGNYRENEIFDSLSSFDKYEEYYPVDKRTMRNLLSKNSVTDVIVAQGLAAALPIAMTLMALYPALIFCFIGGYTSLGILRICKSINKNNHVKKSDLKNIAY